MDIRNMIFFFFSSRRRHTRSLRDWSSDVCSSDLDEAVTFAARDGSAPDTGTAVATALGIRLDIVQADAWRAIPLAEIPFLAADGKGEDVYVAGARPWLAGRVLLTGFHGDAVWGLDPPGLGPDLVRKDQSGLDLCEFRLHAGFIHAPLPCRGGRQPRDNHAPSASREPVNLTALPRAEKCHGRVD